MNQPALLNQMGAFFADLRFVACVCALALYAAWLTFQRPGLVGMARLGLLVAFCATIVAYGVSQVPVQALPFTDFFLFVLLALFLIMEFLFQMSVLGVLVSLLGTVVASLHYWWRVHLVAHAPTSAVQAYWWLLRDLVATVGVASLTLGLGAALLLYFNPDRRAGGKLVHPNDLKDVAAILARGAVPCFLFALAFELGGLLQSGLPTWADAWTLSWLAALFVASLFWLFQAEGRRFVGPRVLGLILMNVVALVAYSAERLIFSSLTGGPRMP
jgi:hypothetical protein